MSGPRNLILISALVAALPGVAAAQPRWSGPAPQAAFSEGYERGVRAGVTDGRRGDAFRFNDEDDYRRGDIGYRSQFGTRDRYRIDFRIGFERGYRSGYEQSRVRAGSAPWSNTRGPWRSGRNDLASATGFSDGYQAGANDARNRRRFDPVSESRYRSGDHGYERWYGSRDVYKDNYREAFRDGYREGYQDIRR